VGPFRQQLRQALAAVVVLLCATPAWSTSISGPSTSTTGSFQLTWPSGYELWLHNAAWQLAGPTSTAHDFTDLPTGTYRFGLRVCALQYIDWVGYHPVCQPVAGSEKVVTVTRDTLAAIDTATQAAGTTPYQASVSVRGASRLSVPLSIPSGINGVAPVLSLEYDSARGSDKAVHGVDDLLGYGWSLQGVSTIHRCRGGVGGGTGELKLDTTDRLCLDGVPLLVVSGTYWAVDAVYRTDADSGVRVTARNTVGIGSWFEVQYPDGGVARFGDSADSKAGASGRSPNLFGYPLPAIPNDIYRWGLREHTGALGNVLTVEYDRFDGYGVLQPQRIAYGGAEIRFEYQPRTDLPLVGFDLAMFAPPLGVWRHAALAGVSVSMNGVPVRAYRLESGTDANGRLRLERVQVCGYDPTGTTATCLRPLAFDWTTVVGGTANYPIAIARVTDGLGAQTEFDYAAITTSSNPLNYSEAPFGSLPAAPNTTAQALAAVSEMRRSDGLGSGGWRRWTYRYKGTPYRNAQHRGYIGFYEVRAKDEQSGW
jgi:hypothetical protein